MIPNNAPIGGEMMDGMDDVDTPQPPMGVDDMGMDGGMDDPMGGAPDAMGPEGGQDPMGDEPPMDDPMGGAPDDMGGDPNAMGGEDNEFMDKFNSLSKEDQVAVEKYTDSMLDDSNDNQMPMESYKSFKRIVDEAINDVLDDYEGTKRPSKELPKQYRMFHNPFKSPF